MENLLPGEEQKREGPKRGAFLRICGYAPAVLLGAIMLGISAIWLGSSSLSYAAAGLGGLSLLGLAVLVVHGVLFETQWRLLEFLVTFVAGTFPAAIFIRLETDRVSAESWPTLAGYLVAGALVSTTCSLIGISVARMIGETRAWRRLWLIALSWLGLIGFGCFVVALLMTVGMLIRAVTSSYFGYCVGLWAAAVPGMAVWVWLLRLEFKAHRERKAAEAAVLLKTT